MQDPHCTLQVFTFCKVKQCNVKHRYNILLAAIIFKQINYNIANMPAALLFNINNDMPMNF